MMSRDAIKPYFWDTDVSALDTKKHRRYIIERILELGDEQAFAWLYERFSRRELISAVEESRRLSPKSANFWRLVLTRPRRHD